MTGHGEKLSRKQEQAITALVICASITEAAAQCGLADVTLRRWLKQDGFQTAYREARRAVVQQAIVQVQRATEEAVELEDLEARIAALEAQGHGQPL